MPTKLARKKGWFEDFFSRDNGIRKRRGRELHGKVAGSTKIKVGAGGGGESKKAVSDLRQVLRTFTLNSHRGYCHSLCAVSGSA